MTEDSCLLKTLADDDHSKYLGQLNIRTKLEKCPLNLLGRVTLLNDDAPAGFVMLTEASYIIPM